MITEAWLECRGVYNRGEGLPLDANCGRCAGAPEADDDFRLPIEPTRTTSGGLPEKGESAKRVVVGGGDEGSQGGCQKIN